ncbi:hypothetical protein CW304_16480 [Bacillus sp. UFRGS-B20]|nr:hypothetical protein CW304_16480 [Bacillus sp. UFRGS-B20]
MTTFPLDRKVSLFNLLIVILYKFTHRHQAPDLHIAFIFSCQYKLYNLQRQEDTPKNIAPCHYKFYTFLHIYHYTPLPNIIAPPSQVQVTETIE